MLNACKQWLMELFVPEDTYQLGANIISNCMDSEYEAKGYNTDAKYKTCTISSRSRAWHKVIIVRPNSFNSLDLKGDPGAFNLIERLYIRSCIITAMKKKAAQNLVDAAKEILNEGV